MTSATRTTSATAPKLILSLVLVLLAILIAGKPARAQELRVGRNVVIRADEVIEEDLYAFGDTVVIEGTVKGDVMASGREVRLSGTVEGDLTGCGQTYIVDGRVGDDLRIAGMTIVLGRGARIGGDFVNAALGLETRDGSWIDGSLLFAGYEAKLEGDVVGDFRADAVAIELDGSIGGGVDIAVEDEREAAALFGRIRHVVTVFIIGLLLAWIAPVTFRNLELKAQRRPLAGIGRGVIAIVILFGQALGVLIVVVGLGLAAGFLRLWPLLLPTVLILGLGEGILLAGFWILAAFVAPAPMSMVAGRAILDRVVPNHDRGVLFPLVVGLSMFAVLANVPYLGVLVHLLVVFLALGALWRWLFDSSEILAEPVLCQE